MQFYSTTEVLKRVQPEHIGKSSTEEMNADDDKTDRNSKTEEMNTDNRDVWACPKWANMKFQISQ